MSSSAPLITHRLYTISIRRNFYVLPVGMCKQKLAGPAVRVWWATSQQLLREVEQCRVIVGHSCKPTTFALKAASPCRSKGLYLVEAMEAIARYRPTFDICYRWTAFIVFFLRYPHISKASLCSEL